MASKVETFRPVSALETTLLAKGAVGFLDMVDLTSALPKDGTSEIFGSKVLKT